MAELVVALDVPDQKTALELAALLRPATSWMKVGLELFTACGPAVVRALKEAGCRVFLDLKFHDIPNTVRGAVRNAIAGGADICNIHLSGGEAMSRAAARTLWETPGHKCLLLGVTVLTSDAPEDASGAGGAASGETAGNVADLVLERAVNARAWGLHGVVCSAWEAAAVKKRCGTDFICLCPGIRPAGAAADDQIRILDPAGAVRQGADFLVVGRPIVKAADPLAAATAIVASYSAPGSVPE